MLTVTKRIELIIAGLLDLMDTPLYKKQSDKQFLLLMIAMLQAKAREEYHYIDPDLIEMTLNCYSVGQRLAGLKIDERLTGLTLEERLVGLDRQERIEGIMYIIEKDFSTKQRAELYELLTQEKTKDKE